jgi:hypothetical protein
MSTARSVLKAVKVCRLVLPGSLRPVGGGTSAVRLFSDKVPSGATSTTGKETEKINAKPPIVDCASPPSNIDDDEDDEDMVDMFAEGPTGIEWNGPTKGGTRPEPTRYGDWEKKGRISDF